MRSIRVRQVSQGIFLALFVLLLWGSEAESPFLKADPLAALLNALSARALYRGLLWSLVILVATLFLGRFFCGWICPLGTLQHIFGNLRSERKRGHRLIESNRYHGWQKLKYYVLIAGLTAAFLGSGVLGWLDPIALAIRSFTLSVFPALNAVTGHLFLKQPHFRQSLFVAAVFLAILVLNLRVTRFFCRALCPLGALLGAVSRWSLLRLERSAEQCGDCNRCLLHCQGGDDPLPGARWRKSECHLCLNCVADCPDGNFAFRFGVAKPGPEQADGPELTRRRALTGLAAGVALVPLARIGSASRELRDRLVRPPGSLDEAAFLARCIRCGACMEVCPSNAIHPSFVEAGAEGLWTPVVVPRIGYCQPSCVLCGEVCPTGAIWQFTAREKGWRGEAGPETKPIRIGTAFYDRGRCLPWAMATECIVCEEWCPTSPKAVYLRQAEVFDAAGNAHTVRQPYIDPARCVGCGACEYACPVADRPAVYVTSVGESRSKSNQLLLRKTQPAAAAPALPESGAAAGWQKTGPTETYPAARLWQYIDGGADKYVNAGVTVTLTAPYKHASGVEAVADLYVFENAAGAARVFDSEASAGGKSAGLGDASRLYSSSLAFRKGRYLVRVVAYTEAPGVPDALTALARAIEAEVSRP